MARPREFDEAAVLDAAIEKFWQRGYEATSVRDLADEMNIAGRKPLQHFRRQAIVICSRAEPISGSKLSRAHSST